MKVYELAKELGIDNKTLMEYLAKQGAVLKSHMNLVPESMVKRARENFAKKSSPAPATSGIKAVALPESIMKKVEAEARAKEKLAAEKETGAKQQEKTAVADDAAKKKKKISAVLNPQYAASLKAKAAQNNAAKQAKAVQSAAPKKPAQTRTYIPARDRKPDDYVEPVEVKEEVKVPPVEEPKAEPSEVKAETKPVAEAVPEVKAAPEAEPVITKPEAVEEVKPEEKKPEEKKSEEKKPEEKKPEEKKPEQDKPAKENKISEKRARDIEKKNEAKAKTQAQIKAETSRPGESEAIKSLRAKIVKGTINPDDLLTSKPAKKGGQNTQGSAQGKGGQQGRGNFNKNAKGNAQGGFNKDDDKDNNQRQSTARRNTGTGASAGGAPQSAPDTKGRGKGKTQTKGKYDKKNQGDKFDRLENEKAAQRTSKQPVKVQEEEEIKVISIPDTIELKEFAAKLKMQPAALIKELFLKGKVFTVNDILDYETAEEIALEKDIICEHEVEVNTIEELLKEEEDPAETLVKRPPVVCIMGHVDHGKTSLLDAIRNTNVTAREAGGITQHIGAYTVSINGESITFLDTPGHEAFTAMRLRGAQATDVAILVVAADDGVKPQTVEAINHAKAAGIHVIVAVNKIDKPAANIDKVKQELSDLGLIPEEWGGNTIFAPVSAKTGEGIENLLEMVILDTEILELKANPNRKARGVVIEAKLDKGRGSVATLLVQKGTLKVGDHIAIGEAYGKVRSMTNDKGQKVKTALPSTPVEITGLNGVPNAGETFVAFDNDKDAKQFAQVYVAENKKKLLAGSKNHVSLDDMFDQMKAGELKELNIIVKADVQGSVEAIKESLEKLSNDEIVVKCIHTGAGNVTINDATLASASNALIIAFNVGVNPDARDLIEHEKVDMRTYSVIYNAIDDVELAMKGMYEPVYEESVIGHVEVRQTFKASGVGIIAGSYVLDGVVRKSSKVRLSRDGEQLFDGAIASLKRFNDDAREVKSGYECGIVLKDFQDIREGDIMEVYEMREVPRQ
ncbi:MAG: translation initiation factor IF-2 [Lachnospiraceae bacterium]|nr:translation initiation factor IF-2 [Lachnospiraceae bacterium]